MTRASFYAEACSFCRGKKKCTSTEAVLMIWPYRSCHCNMNLHMQNIRKNNVCWYLSIAAQNSAQSTKLLFHYCSELYMRLYLIESRNFITVETECKNVSKILIPLPQVSITMALWLCVVCSLHIIIVLPKSRLDTIKAYKINQGMT